MLKPGSKKSFWDAQLKRGLTEDIRPIMGRVIGWFEAESGPSDQIIHFWRYDNFEDWHRRLYFKSDRADNYYSIVRPLMTTQENLFMVPVANAALTPLWGNGRDWLPGGPYQGDLSLNPNLLIEEKAITFYPGKMQYYFAALQRNQLYRDALIANNLIGYMSTLVGLQNKLYIYYIHESLSKFAERSEKILLDERFSAFKASTLEYVLQEESIILRPGPIAACTPLIRYPSP